MLRVGLLTGDRAAADSVIKACAQFGVDTAQPAPRTEPEISVQLIGEEDPGGFAFVIGVGHLAPTRRNLADVLLPGPGLLEAVGDLRQQRLLPFANNLHTGTRARRTRHPVIVDPDPEWPVTARRLIGRVSHHLGTLALRVDHIGSTSVPGLRAKDLIDIQVVVRGQADAEQAADSLRPAGLVRVGGSWFGPGIEGREHPEEVCVDADPGRPVNVNIRSIDAPVWRDTLLMRDWLRGGADRRAEYEQLKRSLAHDHQDVDAYGAAKAEWMSTALAEAEQWATLRNWTPRPGPFLLRSV